MDNRWLFAIWVLIFGLISTQAAPETEYVARAVSWLTVMLFFGIFFVIGAIEKRAIKGGDE